MNAKSGMRYKLLDSKLVFPISAQYHKAYKRCKITLDVENAQNNWQGQL